MRDIYDDYSPHTTRGFKTNIRRQRGGHSPDAGLLDAVNRLLHPKVAVSGLRWDLRKLLDRWRP